MYVMTIENYYDENYISYVKSKDYINNYKEMAWGYSKELNEEDICKLIAMSHLAPWHAIIDLNANKILTLDESRALWKKYGKEEYINQSEEDFENAFEYNIEKS